MPELGPGERAASRRAAADDVRVPPALIDATDERLAAEMARGSEPAFEVFYARHYSSVHALCRRMLGSTEEADDALQQAMASIWCYFRRGDPKQPRNVKPWMYAIARNRCLAMLEARHPNAEPELADLPDSFDLGEEVERRLELRALLRDVGDLPDEQRSALVLSELEGMSHADVANVLGRRTASIKTLVFQARSRLVDFKRARDLPCWEVRRQLLELRGGALRRRTLRRHLQLCADCRAWRDARVGSGIRSLIPLLSGLRWLADLVPGGPSELLAPLGVIAIGAPLIAGGPFHGHSLSKTTDPPAPIPSLTAGPSATSLGAPTFPSFGSAPRFEPPGVPSLFAAAGRLPMRSSSGVVFAFVAGSGAVQGLDERPSPALWGGATTIAGFGALPGATTSSSSQPSGPATASSSPAAATSGSTGQAAGDQGEGTGQSGSGQGQGNGEGENGQGQNKGDGQAGQGGNSGQGKSGKGEDNNQGHATDTTPPGHAKVPPGQQSDGGSSSSSGDGVQQPPQSPPGLAGTPTPPAGGLGIPPGHRGGSPPGQGGPPPLGHGRPLPSGHAHMAPEPGGDQQGSSGQSG